MDEIQENGTILLIDWIEFGRMLYEQDEGVGHSFRTHGVKWDHLPTGVQQIWANRAERAVRAFLELVPPDIQQRLQLMMLEEGSADRKGQSDAL